MHLFGGVNVTKKVLPIFSLSLLILVLSACSGSMEGMDHSNMDMEGEHEGVEDVTTKELPETVSTAKIEENKFTLVAQERKHELIEGKYITAWTFNGSVPGPEIRVPVGEDVQITLKNELREPVTIHWHGIPVPNNMDGIPGETMNAVQPGEEFTYKFKASIPGTYWYHSHQDGVNQVDKGLYGSFIIENKNIETYDKDYTLVIDEWMSTMGSMQADGSSASSNMEGMDHSKEEDDSVGHDMNSMYDIFTINGKSGKSILPLHVKEGDKVRIRLVNAGFMTHKIHLHGHEFRVIGTDGQEINDPAIIKDELISIAAGERYDLEFIANNPGSWYIENHGKQVATPGMKTLIEYEGFSGKSVDQPNEDENLPIFDLTSYGKSNQTEFSLDQEYDLDYSMNLNTVSEGKGEKYTINNQVFPNTDHLQVKEGDLIKVKLVNNSKRDDHPMHLHGHFFQVLSKDGKAVQGSTIIKDTLNLKPGEEYVVAFKADNPGNWMFHCHDLHHASAGMVTHVTYDGFKPDFVFDPNANNKPE